METKDREELRKLLKQKIRSKRNRQPTVSQQDILLSLAGDDASTMNVVTNFLKTKKIPIDPVKEDSSDEEAPPTLKNISHISNKETHVIPGRNPGTSTTILPNTTGSKNESGNHIDK